MRNFRFFPSFTGQKMIKKFQIIIKVPSERAHFFTPCRMNFEIICNRSIFSKFLRKYPYSYLLIPGVILVDTMFFGMLSRVYPCQTVCDIQYVRCLNIKNRFFWLWFLAEPPKSQSGKLSSPPTTSRDSYAAWLLERGETHHKIQRVSTTPTKPTLSREINFAVQR